MFSTARGGPLSADYRSASCSEVRSGGQKTAHRCRKKRVSPHVLRHTAAMEFLLAGVDRSLIALWLGHESVETTQIYLDANLAIKEEILAKTQPLKSKRGRYRPSDQLLNFLKSL